jgi:NAD(P)-dependent dehydrogenase (short-subunit alcohol dehydrogenase family)
MERNGYGRIVNIASVAGRGQSKCRRLQRFKTRRDWFTKALGKELAGTEIRANCVTLGAVRTAIFDQMTQEHSISCYGRSRWAVSDRSRKSPHSCAGLQAKRRRSAPVLFSTPPAVARRTEYRGFVRQRAAWDGSPPPCRAGRRRSSCIRRGRGER